MGERSILFGKKAAHGMWTLNDPFSLKGIIIVSTAIQAEDSLAWKTVKILIYIPKVIVIFGNWQLSWYNSLQMQPHL